MTSTEILNAGPYAPSEYAKLAAQTPVERLASQWVGCVVDSFEAGLIATPGELASCLWPIAKRLRGEPVEAIGKVLTTQAPHSPNYREPKDRAVVVKKPRGLWTGELLDALRSFPAREKWRTSAEIFERTGWPPRERGRLGATLPALLANGLVERKDIGGTGRKGDPKWAWRLKQDEGSEA